MSLLLESIRLEDGKFENLFHHEQRMHRSLQMLCGDNEHFDLEKFLSDLNVPQVGLYKCRIVYDDRTKEVEFLPYVWKNVTTLRLVEHDRVSYEFKFNDRRQIDRLFQLRKECDDILIVKRGIVTDSSFANIAFRRENKWYTPWSPLLKGTYRQKLIDQNLLVPEEIRRQDIYSFDTFRLLNAMWRFDGPELSVSNIVKN
ncbi:MAG TPA: aminotransferase class IV [Chryseosolibacter sp.]|nr:aminotransferase class IV [Chryseosolibacter sp.]